MGLSVEKVCKQDFDIAFGTLKKRAVEGSAHAEVLDKIDLMVNVFCEYGQLFVAKNEADSCVGLLTMTKRTGEWYVDDLVSFQKGAGSQLADAAIEYALEDNPNKSINLISLNKDSTAFWKSRGFVINGVQDADGANVGMRRFAPREK